MVRKNKKMPREIKVSDLEFPKELLESGELYFTQSLLSGACNCDYKLLFSSNLWSKPGNENNFYFGDVFHELLDYLYTHFKKKKKILSIKKLEKLHDKYIEKKRQSGEMYWINDQRIEEYKAVIMTVLEGYIDFYADDFKDYKFVELERVFDVRFLGFRMKGKKDGVLIRKSDGKKFLFEHKTKGQIREDVLDVKLNLDFQCNYYILSDYIESGEYADGVIYNVIRRPQNRRLKNETLADYAEKIRKAIESNPEHYYKRWEVTYTKAEYKDFRKELKLWFKHVSDVIMGKRKPKKNRFMCDNGFTCPYLSACTKGNMSGYKQRKVLSPELE